MLTDLEVATQYILKIIRCLYKTVQVADTEADKNCTGLMFVVFINKESEETLKLLVNFQMMRKSSFTMD